MSDEDTLTEIIDLSKAKDDFLLKIPIRNESYMDLESNEPFSSALAYLDLNHLNASWKSTRFQENSCKPNDFVRTDFETAFLSIMETLYGCVYSKINTQDLCLHLLNLKNFKHEQKHSKFILEYDIRNLSNLHSVLLYSPRALDSYEKILFILFQLLNFVKHLHANNINFGEVKLKDVYIDKNFWIRVKLPFENILNMYKVNKEEELMLENEAKCERDPCRLEVFFLKENLESIYESFGHLTNKDMANITKDWCNNKISNFSYLLMLNRIAGRKLNCPFNHPIFPWITDFQSINTNLRDLTMSKFRLNKGDAHLDLIYQSCENIGTLSHHLTEILSEITYFVYKSRVTSKETLCKHVRRQWVPNEYPVSINRLYSWTPEECIPEFYCDPSVFKSIHDDLPDLKVPDWCNGSVDEFIRTHRMLLDSDLVSKKLNNWIDLIFGYKLSGESAIESKNVCLPLIDNHQNMKTYGIVQLFNIPHPIRSVEKAYHNETAPRMRNKAKLKIELEDLVKSRVFQNVQDSVDRKKSVNKADLADNQIILPDDYNPMALVEQLEMLFKFTNKVYHCLPDISEKKLTNETNFEKLAQMDLKCLTCLLVEIVLFHKLKCLPQDNSIQTRHEFICKAIIQEPHLLNGPFMHLILSVLKPFGDVNIDKMTNLSQTKKGRSGIPYFLEHMLKLQSESVNINTLLNKDLSVLPFKPYFQPLYKFCELFAKMEYLIKYYDHLKQNKVLRHHLFNILSKLNRYQDGSATSVDDELKINLESLNKSEENEEDILTKREFMYEQKFYLALLYLPNLLYDMTDPRKNNLAQSICLTCDSYELIIPYLLSLFESQETCINSLLFLFNKLAKFISHGELVRRFLPIIIQILNVVDLNETLGIDLSKDDEKIKFCKFFDFTFMNELRIIFGLKVFLTQICPFLIEAISGFKDFDFESDSVVNQCSNMKSVSQQTSDDSTKKAKDLNRIVEQTVFELEGSSGHTDKHGDEEERYSNDVFTMNTDEAKPSTSFNKSSHETSLESNNDATSSSIKQNTNISTTAYNTFVNLIGTLGPVLTCKYCCTDLFKMLAICYMNNKCLNPIESNENFLNSIRPIEGDRFAYLILESLKAVACLYGEQVIVLQYLTHFSNTVSVSASRLTTRLESSLIAGVVLVNYFLNFLDIKILMENLNYVLNQIVLPIIKLYSNEKAKFPNGYLSRQVLAFKILDIMLILSLRIGPEQTRIEMGRILRAYFEGFTLVRSVVSANVQSKPLQIGKSETKNNKTPMNRGIFKARASLVNFNNQKLCGFTPGSTNENLNESDGSVDDYIKYSFDSITNEVISSSFKKHQTEKETQRASFKLRSNSFGILHNQENEIESSSFGTDGLSSSYATKSESKYCETSVSDEANSFDEIVNTFTPELAHTAYLSISRLNSGNYIDSILTDPDLIHRLCTLDEQMNKKSLYRPIQLQRVSKQNDHSNPSSYQASRYEKPAQNLYSSSYGSSFSESVGVIGNQIQIVNESVNFNADERHIKDMLNEVPNLGSKFTLRFTEKDLKEYKNKIDTTRHLSDNWLAYWENAVRANNSLFDLKQINLLTLNAHSGGVKCLCALDNESSIMSGGKDKTVKLWSLKNQSTNANKKNSQSCQWTYNQHKKPVNSILFIDSLRVCASCDGSVHIWNPFVGKKLFQLESQLITCMSNLSSPSASFVVATSDNIVRFVDLRKKSFAYELRTCFASAGTIKCISTNDHLLTVGFSTGLICLLDMRTGWIQEGWKTCDSEILQMKFVSNDRLICSYNDGSISMSSIKEKIQTLHNIKDFNEPLPYMIVNNNQLITATSSNKIGIHSNIDKLGQTQFSMDKLKPDSNFKAPTSSLIYLPMNQTLLLGSDNGDIKLLC